jgi:hypothetical protein
MEKCISGLYRYNELVLNHHTTMVKNDVVWFAGIPYQLLVALCDKSITITSIQFCHLVGANELLGLLAHGAFPTITKLVVMHTFHPRNIDVPTEALYALLRSPRSSLREFVALPHHRSTAEDTINIVDALEDPYCRVRHAEIYTHLNYCLLLGIHDHKVRDVLVVLVHVLPRDILRRLKIYLL